MSNEVTFHVVIGERELSRRATHAGAQAWTTGYYPNALSVLDIGAWLSTAAIERFKSSFWDNGVLKLTVFNANDETAVKLRWSDDMFDMEDYERKRRAYKEMQAQAFQQSALAAQQVAQKMAA